MKKLLLISAAFVFASAAFCQTKEVKSADNSAKKASQPACVPDPKTGKVCPDEHDPALFLGPAGSSMKLGEQLAAFCKKHSDRPECKKPAASTMPPMAASAFGETNDVANYETAKHSVLSAHADELKNVLASIHEQNKKDGIQEGANAPDFAHSDVGIEMAAEQTILQKYSAELHSNIAALNKQDKEQKEKLIAAIKAENEQISNERKAAVKNFFTKIYRGMVNFSEHDSIPYQKGDAFGTIK